MSFIGRQTAFASYDAVLQTAFNVANAAVQTGFPTISIGVGSANTGLFTTMRANSGNDVVLLRAGAGITVNTTNSISKTVMISTTSDLRVSQNSALLSTNNWTGYAGTVQDSFTWGSLAWSPELGLFVASAYNGSNSLQRVMTSTDGRNWGLSGLPTVGTWWSMVWSPERGIFVMVSDTGTHRVATSPDGITWTARTIPVLNPLFSLCWAKGLGLFVALSYVGGADDTTQIMTSPDGITWTARTAPTDEWSEIMWCHELGILVASGLSAYGTARMMTSTDGITWTARSLPANYAMVNIESIAWSPELALFVALPNIIDKVLTSRDGITWTEINTNMVDHKFYRVIWVPHYGAFVATGYTGTIRMMISFDGVTWSARTTANQNDWGPLAWSPELGILVALSDMAVGTTRVMVSQPTGIWTRISKRQTVPQVRSQISIGF